VRNLALSLVLVEHMNDKLHAQQIKQEFLRALLAGTLAEELSAGRCVRTARRRSFLGAMFRNLGRLLTEFYFPEEAEQVRRLVQPGVPAARENPRLPVPESSASRSVLGLSSRSWASASRATGPAETLQRCMRLTEAGMPPSQPPGALPERLRWIASAAKRRRRRAAAARARGGRAAASTGWASATRARSACRRASWSRPWAARARG
jgi:hypothetical protein